MVPRKMASSSAEAKGRTGDTRVAARWQRVSPACHLTRDQASSGAGQQGLIAISGRSVSGISAGALDLFGLPEGVRCNSPGRYLGPLLYGD